MAKKRSGKSAVSSISRVRKRTPPRQNAALVGNPQGGLEAAWTETWEIVGPAVAGYAGTRIAGRVAFKVGKKKSLGFAKHIGPATSVLAALGVWWATRRFEALGKYHVGATAGAAVAAVQGLVQTYVPMYGWVLNDFHMDDQVAAAPTPAPSESNAQQQAPSPQGGYHDGGLSDVLDIGETEADLMTGIFSP